MLNADSRSVYYTFYRLSLFDTFPICLQKQKSVKYDVPKNVPGEWTILIIRLYVGTIAT